MCLQARFSLCVLGYACSELADTFPCYTPLQKSELLGAFESLNRAENIRSSCPSPAGPHKSSWSSKGKGNVRWITCSGALYRLWLAPFCWRGKERLPDAFPAMLIEIAPLILQRASYARFPCFRIFAVKKGHRKGLFCAWLPERPDVIGLCAVFGIASLSAAPERPIQRRLFIARMIYVTC